MRTHVIDTTLPPRTEDDGPVTIPAVELRGSPVDRLKSLDAAIKQLQSLRQTLTREPVPGAPPNEFYGPYVNAPVWPWTVAGWALALTFMVLFVITWLRS